jgi:hypothetical protein
MTSPDDLASLLATEFAPQLSDPDDYRDDDGTILGYLLLGALALWTARGYPSNRQRVIDLLTILEQALNGADQELANLVAVGFVEMLPYPQQPGAEVLRELDAFPLLRAEAVTMLGLT